MCCCVPLPPRPQPHPRARARLCNMATPHPHSPRRFYKPCRTPPPAAHVAFMTSPSVLVRRHTSRKPGRAPAAVHGHRAEGQRAGRRRRAVSRRDTYSGCFAAGPRPRDTPQHAASEFVCWRVCAAACPCHRHSHRNHTHTHARARHRSQPQACVERLPPANTRLRISHCLFFHSLSLSLSLLALPIASDSCVSSPRTRASP